MNSCPVGGSNTPGSNHAAKKYKMRSTQFVSGRVYLIFLPSYMMSFFSNLLSKQCFSSIYFRKSQKILGCFFVVFFWSCFKDRRAGTFSRKTTVTVTFVSHCHFNGRVNVVPTALAAPSSLFLTRRFNHVAPRARAPSPLNDSLGPTHMPPPPLLLPPPLPKLINSHSGC